MITRSYEFYDVISQGLAALGFKDDVSGSSLTKYLDDMFALKYNADQTFAQEGFPLNPNIPLDSEWEQLNATIRPYTLAAHVDIDSDGPTKSTDGLTLNMGNLPTFKHEVPLSKKTVREKLQLAQRLGALDTDIVDTIMNLFFMSNDSLLGGNYNTVLYMRNQLVSNMANLIINGDNSPLGIPLSIDFGVPQKNKISSVWYTVSDGNVVQSAEIVSGSIIPMQVLRNVKKNAETIDFCPTGHWEISKGTKEALISMKYWRDMYTSARYTDTTNLALLSQQATDDDMIAYISRIIGAPIIVKDHIAQIEKFNTTTKKVEYTNLNSFKDGVMVYVPDGAIGDCQFGKPFAIDMPGAKIGWYDGGRTLLRSIFYPESMSMVVKSEFSGMPVPNKTKWMYYVTIQG